MEALNLPVSHKTIGSITAGCLLFCELLRMVFMIAERTSSIFHLPSQRSLIKYKGSIINPDDPVHFEDEKNVAELAPLLLDC